MATEVITVSFDGDGLRLDTSEDAETICQQLTDKSVEVLILQGNTFGIEAAERVGIELSFQTSLREAHFKDLFTSRGREEVPEAMGHLLRGISSSGAQLTLLDLSDNAIGPIGAPSVIEFLESASSETLEILYLNNCGLGPEGSTSIATTISKLKHLRQFVCGRNRLENKGATNMSRALSELNRLETLKLAQNGIGVEGIRKLVDTLLANLDTIKEIDFSDNTIKAEGAKALAKAIVQAKNLKVLRLDDALLENEGFSIICDALSKSPSLNSMDLASFEGNELHGQRIIDHIEMVFSVCKPSFQLNFLENDFTRVESTRLTNLSRGKFEILVDDSDGDEDDEETDEQEEGELDDASEESNGYVDIGDLESDLREVVQDFIKAFEYHPRDMILINTCFLQLISTGLHQIDSDTDYNAVQIICEEMGLMKLEETRKAKPLARDAIVYTRQRLRELPTTCQNFFEAVVKNNDNFD